MRECAYHGCQSETGDVIPLELNFVPLASLRHLPSQLTLGVAADGTDSFLSLGNELQGTCWVNNLLTGQSTADRRG